MKTSSIDINEGWDEKVLRNALVAIFTLASLAKVVNLRSLYQTIQTSNIFPESMLWALVYLIVSVEMALVVMLVIRVMRHEAYILATTCSASFLVFSLHRFLRDGTSTCHCFGDLIHLNPLQSLTLSLLMFLGGLRLILLSLSRRRVSSATPGSNRKMLSSVGILSAIFLAMAGFSRLSAERPPSFVSIPVSDLIGYALSLDEIKGKHTIVMFGDYECPPCKSSKRLVNNFLSKNAEVRFVFRNLPLEPIHPHANKAAELAEKARLLGRFQIVHDSLYDRDSLDASVLKSVERQYELFGDKQIRETAAKRLSADKKFTEQYRISSTPTFFLIDSKGRVLKYENLELLFKDIG